MTMENQGSSSSGSTTIFYSLYIENNAHLAYNLLVERGVPRVQGEYFSPSFCFLCVVWWGLIIYNSFGFVPVIANCDFASAFVISFLFCFIFQGE